MEGCSTCGGFKQQNQSRLTALEEAQRKTHEEGKPFCVCEEGGEYFATSVENAFKNRFKIDQVISRLPSSA